MTDLHINKHSSIPKAKGPVVLIIIDGVGIGARDEFDAFYLARTPVLESLFETGEYRTLLAHGTAVGLPTDGDLGGSEVGHNTMGAGRIIDQGPKLVDNAFADDSVFSGHWKNVISNIGAGGALHLVGLLSDGGIHSNDRHMHQMIERARSEGVQRLYVHVLLDGRDVPDKTGHQYISAWESVMAPYCEAGMDYRIVSVGGRIVSVMDRYNANWSVVETGWNAMVHGFFEYYDKKIEEFPDKKQEYLKEKEEAQKQYSFWFKRKRYDSSKSVPKKDVIVLFSYVYRWATKQLEENLIKVDMFQKRIDNPSTPYNSYVEYNNKKEVLQNAQPALECLRKQSDNILEVLNALPAHDNFLTSLRLERLVKTINEPAAIRFRSAESEHLPFVYLPASVVRPTDDVVWWNFVDVKTNPGFGNWYKNERGFLSQNYVNLSSSEDQNRLLLWQRMQPVLKARKRLILVIPDFIDGKDQLPHPLWGDLCAALGENNLKAISVNPDNKANLDFFTTFFSLPDFEKLQQRMLVKPKPYFYLKDTASIQFVQKQSFTSLNSLLYYPYQWLFNYQAKFRKASILSVTKDRRLMGNIAHSVFEGLFNAVKSSDQHWNKSEVF